ncbi:MAG: protein kinase [Aggregatilineales bacterium]
MSSHNDDPKIIGNRYEILNRIGSGGLGTVYRVRDRVDGQIVALKRVTEVSGSLFDITQGKTSDIRMSLAREFKTLASLHHPNIINVLDYGFDVDEDAQIRLPYYTMELLDDAKTLTHAGFGQPLKTQMTLLIQLLQALSYLYRRGILHRDLKPANVLVVSNPDSDELTVKVLDFSLATLLSKRATDTDPDIAAGTLAYMPPEVLQGTEIGIPSDLYAVGVMAYEMLTGKHPYDTTNITRLIQSIISDDVDVSRIDAEAALQNVIGCLLDKESSARYQSAEAVMSDIRIAIGADTAVQTQEIKRAYLEAADFIGRDREVSKFMSELYRAIGQKTGSAWLIGGESGVGKSRLMEELRAIALVNGVMVLRGQSVSDGNLLYGAWTDILKRLVLLTRITDDEAAILKPIIPEIDGLIGHDLPKAEVVDPQATQIRLLNTVETLFVKVLKSTEQPIMLILEDLHWAESATLRLTEHLSAALKNQPVVIFGTYRNDSKPELHKELPSMQRDTLGRLQEADMIELTVSIIGDNGRTPGVADLIKRETGGNVYFMIEVIRALAEELGDFDEIGAMTLPQSVFAEGIGQIIRRRLESVPHWARDLLRLSAVIGRQIDLDLLRHIVPDADLDKWVTICVDCMVINADDSGSKDHRWRFAHDKLREALLEELTPAQRISLNQRVAEGIESAHPDTRLVAPRLAYHWGQAGDPFRELLYRGTAGQQAIRNSANQEAINHFSRALELLESLPLPDKHAQELQLHLALGGAAMVLKGYAAPEVETAFARARILAEDAENPAITLKVLASLSGYYVARADFHTAQQIAENMLSLAERTGVTIHLLWAHLALGQVHGFMGHYQVAADHLEQVVNAYDPTLRKDKIKRNPLQDFGVFAGELLAMTYWQLGLPDQALVAAEYALNVARELEHPISIAFALHWTGIIHYFRGDYATCLSFAEDTIALSDQHEFALFSALGTMWRGMALSQIEHRFDEDILALMQRGLNACQETGAVFCIPFFLTNIAQTRIYGGQVDVALNEMDVALSIIDKTDERWSEPDIYRMRGEFLIQKGDFQNAEADLIRARDIALERGGLSWALRAAISLARLWESQGKGDAGREQLRTIFDQFTEGLTTADLQIARDLLDSAAIT